METQSIKQTCFCQKGSRHGKQRSWISLGAAENASSPETSCSRLSRVLSTTYHGFFAFLRLPWWPWRPCPSTAMLAPAMASPATAAVARS